MPAVQEEFVLVRYRKGKFGNDVKSIKAEQIGHLSKPSKNEGPTNLTGVADEKLPSLLQFYLEQDSHYINRWLLMDIL